MAQPHSPPGNGSHPGGFTRFARWVSCHAGSPGAFLLAVLIIVAWAVTGPMFHYSDTWQLVINTGTTIVTFVMVFLIQNTQNRDSRAIHVKLDELIRAMKGARNSLLNLEELSDEELQQIQNHFARLAEKAKSKDLASKPEASPQVRTR
jgi:low affinity Fe/Cu permease